MSADAMFGWGVGGLAAANGVTRRKLWACLREHGTLLSYATVCRRFHGPPTHISLNELAAYCSIFACTVNDLLVAEAAPSPRRIWDSAYAPVPAEVRIPPELAALRRAVAASAGRGPLQAPHRDVGQLVDNQGIDR